MGLRRSSGKGSPQIKHRIGQLLPSDLLVRLHETPRAGDGVVVVDPGGGDHSSRAEIEDRERCPGEVTAYDGLVPGESRSGVLKVQVVLVGPEPRNLSERLSLTSHRATDGESLPLRSLEMLDANPRLEQRMEETRRISGREDARLRGPALVVDHDAAIDLEPRTLGKLGAWHRPHGDKVGVRRGLSVQPQVDAVATVNIGEVAAALGAQHPEQGLGKRLEEPDLASFLPRHGGDLASDESRADDVEGETVFDPAAQGLGRGQLAQVEDAFETGEAPGVRARGDAQQVPADRLAAFQQHPPGGHAEVEHPVAKLEVDLQLAVLLRGSERKASRRHRPREEALRKMRPLVWQILLAADQHDLTLKAGVAKTGRDGVAGRAGANDYCLRSSRRSLRSDQARYPPRSATPNA